MKFIKSLAILALGVAATISFTGCETKGSVSSTGASASTTTRTSGK